MAEEVIDLSRKKKHGRPRKHSRAKLLARALYIQAKAGHRGAMQLIYERVGGKPLQEIDAKIDATATAITPEQRNARIKELIARAGDL